MAFNVAYCAGFETTATFSSLYLLERCGALFRGGDAYGANLLQWHVAEEFEHRTTCHRALHAVDGGYAMRIADFVYSFWHINVLFGLATDIILARYREGMSVADQKRCRLVRQLKRRQLIAMLPGLLRLVMPGYDPARIAVTPRVQRALDFFRGKGPIIANFSDLAA